MDETTESLQAKIQELEEELKVAKLAAVELPAVRADRVAVSVALDQVRKTFDDFITEAVNLGLVHAVECTSDKCACWMAPFIKVAKDL
jgi:hypothetical protein